MKKTIYLLVLLFLGFFIFPHISFGQYNVEDLKLIDCSKFSENEQVLCNYYNLLIQIYKSYIQLFLLKINVNNIDNNSLQPPFSSKKFYFIDPSPSDVAGGLDIKPGTNYNIRWYSTGIDQFNLYICTVKDECKFIAKINANNQSYQWYVDPNHPYFPGFNLRLKLEDASDSKLYTYSGYFDVATPSSPFIKLIWPNGGEQLVSGQEYSIIWNSNGYSYGYNYVLIDLLGDLNNDGSYEFKKTISVGNSILSGSLKYVFPDVPEGNNYKIMIYASKTPNIYGDINDSSDRPFSIVIKPSVAQPTIRILSPTKGETLTVGQSYTGIFSWSGFTPKSLYVYLVSFTDGLRKASSYIGSINSPYGDRNFNLNIPSNIVPGNYMVGICDEGTLDANNQNVCGWVDVMISSTNTTFQPTLSINKENFSINDTWQLSLTGGPANQPTYICAIDNKGIQSCTPTSNLGLSSHTDVNGNWFASGNWRGDKSVVGTWTEWMYVGGTLSGGQVVGGVRSNNIQFTIVDQPSTYLNLIQLANTINSLDAVINKIRSLFR